MDQENKQSANLLKNCESCKKEMDCVCTQFSLTKCSWCDASGYVADELCYFCKGDGLNHDVCNHCNNTRIIIDKESIPPKIN